MALGAGQAAASSCEVWVGFEDRSITLWEGKTGTLTVKADFKGPIADGYALRLNVKTDAKPYRNGWPIGSDGGAGAGDYIAISQELILSEGADSADIIVEAYEDDEKEDFERFYVNLTVHSDHINSTGSHRTQEEACANPAVYFHSYGFFATVHLRDGPGFTNHWLYGSGG